MWGNAPAGNLMRNKIGMNLLLWGTEITEDLFPVLEEIKSTGFDGVEIPVFNTNPASWQSWRKKLDDLGLARVAVTINGPDFNQVDPDPAHRKATLERNKQALACAAELGSTLLTGPFHSALGVFTGKAPQEEELNWCAENLHELAEHAKSFGITLGLEYLNRFESYLISSTAELIALADRVNHPNCRLMFDTFHANIEEKNLPDAVRAMGSRLVHVQLSENDRSTLGSGHVDIAGVLKALHEIHYPGMLSIEAFSPKLSVANIWRKMFESETILMKESLAHLKTILPK